MIETTIIYFITFFLITIQSVAGVGILVIGTPSLLILNFSIYETLAFLLPISILTSLFNLVYFKYYSSTNRFNIGSNIKISFFVVCVPSIFIGLIFLKNFENEINIKILVCLVIIISFLISRKKNFKKKFNKKYKLFFLFLTGAVHGLTNSGGSLLSLILSSYFNKNQSRHHITYFYFFLAFVQYLMFIYLFDIRLFNIKYIYIFILIPFGIFLGNILAEHINDEKFRNMVSVIAILTCLILLISMNFN